jgi:adenylate kinase
LIKENKAILISGTPGTGKTTLSNKIEEKLGFKIINIGDYAVENNLIYDKDDKRNTLIPDKTKLLKKLALVINNANKPLILEGHYVDIIPTRFVELIIILRMHPDKLSKRLQKKGYSPKKIKENLAAEVLGDCTAHALSNYEKSIVFELNISELNSEEAAEKLIYIIKEKPEGFLAGKINWLSEIEDLNYLEQFFE